MNYPFYICFVVLAKNLFGFTFFPQSFLEDGEAFYPEGDVIPELRKLR